MTYRTLFIAACFSSAACGLLLPGRAAAQEASFFSVTQAKTAYVKIMAPLSLKGNVKGHFKFGQWLFEQKIVQFSGPYRLRFEAEMIGKKAVLREGPFTPAQDGSPFRESVSVKSSLAGTAQEIRELRFVIADAKGDVVSFDIKDVRDETKSDLAITSLVQKGGRMVAVIAATAGHGERGYRFIRQEKNNVVELQAGTIPSLWNESIEVSIDLSKLLGKQPIYLQLAKSSSDSNPQNDTLSAIFDSGKDIATGVPNPKGNANFDLAAYSMRFEGGKLIGVIANRGPGNYPGGGNYELRTSPTYGTKGKLPAIAALKTAQVELAFTANIQVPASFYGTLTLIGHNDANPGNDSLRAAVQTGKNSASAPNFRPDEKKPPQGATKPDPRVSTGQNGPSVLDLTVQVTRGDLGPPWQKIGVDLNAGAGGEYIYLFKQIGTPSVQNPAVTGITVLEGPNAQAPAGWQKVPVDLNKGARGPFLWLAFKRSATETPIADVAVIAGKNTPPVPAGWRRVDVDLNKGVGGAFIFLIYR